MDAGRPVTATAPAAVEAAQPTPLSPPLDHQAWVRFLADHLVGGQRWRPGEFDPDTWLFTGDPANPMTTSTTCRVAACEAVVESRRICTPCHRVQIESDVDTETFVATYRPQPRQRRTGLTCRVGTEGVTCQRRVRSNQTGLCHAHTTQWKRYGKHTGVPLGSWCVSVARPLPARDPCPVAGCGLDAKLDTPLCGTHVKEWQTRRRRIDGRWETAEQWATRRSVLGLNQFSLAELAPTVRSELLYALRHRDVLGQKLDPQAVKALANALIGVEAIATTAEQALLQRVSKNAAARSYARLLTRIVHLGFEQFRGITHTDRDVWDCLALDLESPRPQRRPSQHAADFTPISQEWLRQATKAWVRTLRPDSGQLQRTVLAATLASHALARRPGGGHQPTELTFADMAAVFQEVKTSRRLDGAPYTNHFRRGLWARLHQVIDFGRASGQLAELSGTFTRNHAHTLPTDQANEDEIGKAIPETVIAQLDAHLDLLGTDSTYGRAWSAAASAQLFQTAYQVLRDTGRRPNELVSLLADCVEIDNGDHALIYNNHKSHRLRRRLPITAATAATIQDWQHYRAGLDLPESTQRWLFPSWGHSNGPGHLTTNRLLRALKAWVAAIGVLHSDLPGPDGTPLPFNPTLIYPYAFRHSYAQRHADAGVSVEILKELLDHKDLKVTHGYYTVSLHRKRDAIKIMSRYVHDRTGTLVTSSDSARSYELKSVAVPFGNCIEPTNVKAGGKQCPIRFQCAGCGFYRPDPSYPRRSRNTSTRCAPTGKPP